VFDRYTEKARRTIFFARYEASQTGSAEIEIEHFLLGVLREDRRSAGRLPVEEIRTRIREHFPVKPKISVSVDLPLSQQMKRVLPYGAEEAERLGHKWIDTQHLLLGILREPSLAADLLREYGMTEATVRAGMQIPAPQPKTALLESPVRALYDLQANGQLHLLISTAAEDGVSEARKEAIGHLIDSAIAFHQWLPKALAGKASAFEISRRGLLAEYYQSNTWSALIELWMGMNNFLIHILCQIPEEEAEPIATAATAYVKHCTEVIGAIL
jgi:hypothetical protein